MKPTYIPRFSRWLLAQARRPDGIGQLTELWLSICAGKTEEQFQEWLEERRSGAILKHDIETAEAEYANAVKDIQDGKHTPTFPSLFLRLEQMEFMKNRVVFYKKLKHQSPEEHFNLLKSKLREELSSKRIVYIDTCHWVNLRHSYIDDRKRTKPYDEVLQRLFDLSKAKKIICPFSYPLASELLLQNDENTRFATAKLIDSFSDGVCLQSTSDLIETEVKHLCDKVLFPDRHFDHSGFAWTKIGYFSGEMFVKSQAYTDEQGDWITKWLIDMNWTEGLVETLEMLGGGRKDIEDNTHIARAYNFDAVAYRNLKLPFKELLSTQQQNVIQSYVAKPFSEISKAYLDAYPDEAAKIFSRQPLKSPDPLILPFVQIIAGINAMILSDERRPFKPNDINDAKHAAMALPYCHTFFCEKPLGHLLKNKNLNLAQQYGTKVVTTPEEFLECIADL